MVSEEASDLPQYVTDFISMKSERKEKRSEMKKKRRREKRK